MEQLSGPAIIATDADHRGQATWARKPGYDARHDRNNTVAVRYDAMITTAAASPATTHNVVITPEQAGVCGYCQQPLANGETHLHAGQPNEPGGPPMPPLQAAVVNQYERVMEAAWAAYRAASDEAWTEYRAAVTAAGIEYEQSARSAAAEYTAQWSGRA